MTMLKKQLAIVTVKGHDYSVLKICSFQDLAIGYTGRLFKNADDIITGLSQKSYCSEW